MKRLIVVVVAAMLCLSVVDQHVRSSPGLAASQAGQVRRPGWVCPSGNSFDKCSHECKWMYIAPNGQPDREREIKCGAEIAEHSPQLKQIINRIETVYNGCPKGKTEDAMIIQSTPCNYFAGMVMRDVYGVRDFITKGGFMRAAQIHDYLKTSSVTDTLWQNVNGGDAIIQANAGRPVVASSNGHVAVVIPGGFSYSYRWRDYTPVIASLFLGDPQTMNSENDEDKKFIFRCMPCFTDRGFSSKPAYYYRTK